ncbi:MAG: formate dehydrogenase accessory sulfurtransferase FdhD [Ferruginibacter sp.]
MTIKQVENIQIQKIVSGNRITTDDQVAIEEPLEIRLRYSSATGEIQKNISVTMRTPGNDDELAAGFIFTEGIIKNHEAIREIKSSSDQNSILVVLKQDVYPELKNIGRNFYSTSSCGICGKASIDSIRISSPFYGNTDNLVINATVFNSLQSNLENQQIIFKNTGGIHACILFDQNGNLLLLREDVGRHNALDKIIGASLINGEIPLDNCILFLSGRSSFELIQKAVMAGIKIIASVGAPSSLAIELAKEAGITLIGFLRSDRFNIYSGNHRIAV